MVSKPKNGQNAKIIKMLKSSKIAKIVKNRHFGGYWGLF
jgi:hypothetical protein